MKKNLYRFAFCVVPVVAGIVAGCGDKTATTTAPSNTSAPPAATAPAAGGAEQPGAKTNYQPAAEAAQYQQKAGGSAVTPNAR